MAARSPGHTSNSAISEIVRSANAQVAAGLRQLAVASFRQVLKMEPSHVDSLLSLSMLAREDNNLAEAADCMRRVVDLYPNVARYHIELGRILFELQLYDQAERQFREAIRLDPRMVWASLNLAAVLLALGRIPEAEQSCRDSVRVRPDLEWAHLHLGNVLRVAQRLPEAEACCREALRLRPDFARAHAQLGNVLLMMGRLEEGWPEREWARQVPLSSGMIARIREQRQIENQQPAELATQLDWNGEALDGKTLLLHPDEGLGDIIQFCRYASQLATRARVIVRAPDSLVRLLSSLSGIERTVSVHDPLPHFDMQCRLMRLPMIFRTTLDTIPADVPYLKADPTETAQWRGRLAGFQGLKVGLVWAGGTIGEHAVHRSLKLTSLTCLASMAGVHWFSLQKDGSDEIRRVSGCMTIHDWIGECRDFADTAAFIEALDLVISVDTSVAHLAGALGKNTWLLNRYDTCWRWLHNRDDSPWYPSLRIFRQPSPLDWHSVILKLSSALDEVVI